MFVAALKGSFVHNRLDVHGTLKPSLTPQPFPPGREPSSDMTGTSTPNVFSEVLEQALRDLGRCPHRVAISNHRLVSLADQKVTFRWRVSAHHNEPQVDVPVLR
jgi:hypothetical protein